jgi:hypothetical protein
MRCVLLGLVIVTAGLALPGEAQAQFGIWRRKALDYERNKHWPEPFIHWDRDAARAPWIVQIDRGWELQNTVGDFHFHRETNQLTTAGEHKLEWIVHEAPVHRRTVFVQRGRTADETATRIDAVQQAVAKVLPEGPLPEVLATTLSPPGAPADIIDRVYRGRDAAQPAPVLPAAQASSGSGGSGN